MPVRLHVLQVAATPAQFFHHRALVGIFHVHGQHLERLALLAVDFAIHHARFAHAHFEAFAAHVFQKNGQMQFAAPGQQEHIGVVCFLNTQRHIHQQLFVQAVAYLTTGNELAFLTTQR